MRGHSFGVAVVAAFMAAIAAGCGSSSGVGAAGGANAAAQALRFAGPQVQPWTCTTTQNGLGAPVDDQCNAAAPVVSYKYKNAASGQIGDYDPANPPPSASIATTTTDQGKTVPYVIRYERGTMDRSIYYIAVLVDPANPSLPAGAWNHKLLVPFGGSCSATHSQQIPGAIEVSKAAPDDAVLLDQPLSMGYLVATTGLSTLGQDCNPIVSAEVLLMLKQYLASEYGSIRFTVGEGCSGGSVQQHTIADDYPGLLNGLIPSCSFPDLWSPITEVFDCALVEHYLTGAGAALWANPAARVAVTGSETEATCAGWVGTFLQVLNPADNVLPPTACDIPNSEIYNASTNPKGVRCTAQDYGIAIWGRRDGDGFAKRPLDNVGLQYGYDALMAGTISADQFVDLNQNIGGLDIDGNYASERTVADPGAVGIAYRSGMMASHHQTARVPIIDVRGLGNEEVHTDFWSYATRERLKAANGTADNQVIWTSAVDNFEAIGYDTTVAPLAFTTMDRWLTAIEADHGSASLPEKVIQDKPAEAVDACFVGASKITDATQCSTLYPYFANPRIVAGGPLASDVIKCQLKPLLRTDYPPALTDSQWSQLMTIFPGGVCDFSLPAAGREPQLVWPTFANGPGGQPIPNPPST